MQTDTFFETVIAGDAAGVRVALLADPGLAHARTTPEQTPEDCSNWTALHLAAYHGHADMARALAEAGADLDALHGADRTALHVALEYNDTTCEVLIGLGAMVDVWAAAALEKMERLEEILHDNPASATDTTGGLSPLGWTGYFNASASARLLIEHGADVDDGSLSCAASTNSAGVGRVFLEAGADPNRTGQDRVTALHVAAAMRYTSDSQEFIELLLEFGADINAQMTRGLTPLDLALRCRAGYEMEQRGRKLEGDPLLPGRNYDAVIELLRARGGQELSCPEDI